VKELENCGLTIHGCIIRFYFRFL